MDHQRPPLVEDQTTAHLFLVLVNLLWVFAAIWSAWGLGPVLILAAVLNHLITRLECRKRRKAGRLRPTEEI
ncbi:histidinol phosphate aminotransferase [Pacificoceanicola onchidii]|uniref:histidinol phosphate aminotransferase n=1 Tax=Pacificoceanicola onchidii TaxID=2562685 RepID=UPI0010A3A869|nr:histidinol phosphate aminotransferase [Pacificoceanicola onchidii]